MDDTYVDNQDRDDSADISISREYFEIRGAFDGLGRDRLINPEKSYNSIRTLIMRMNLLKESPAYKEHPDRWIFDSTIISLLDERMQHYHEWLLGHDIIWAENYGLPANYTKRDDLPYFTIQEDKRLLEFMADEFAASEEMRCDWEDMQAESESSQDDSLTARLYQRALKSRNRVA